MKKLLFLVGVLLAVGCGSKAKVPSLTAQEAELKGYAEGAANMNELIGKSLVNHHVNVNKKLDTIIQKLEEVERAQLDTMK